MTPVGRGGGLLGYCGHAPGARRLEPRSVPSRVRNRDKFRRHGPEARRLKVTHSGLPGQKR
jgi:hypothetical protein